MSSSKFAFKAKKTTANGEPAAFVKPAAEPKDAMKAVAAIVLNHTAEVFYAVVEAIADKYGLDKEAMTAAISEHPKFKEITLHPVLNDMGFLTKAEEEASVSAVPKKKFVFKKKTVANNTPVV